MKTLSRIADVLLLVALVCSILITTFIGASASVVGNGVPLLPTHNLKNISIDTAYASTTNSPAQYYNGLYSLGQPIVTYYGQIADGMISYDETQPSVGGKHVYVTNKVALGDNSRLFAYFYGSDTRRPIAENNAYLCGELSLTFNDYIFDPSLVQGEANVYLDWETANLASLREEYINSLTRTEISYVGSVRYPTMSGSYVDIPFDYYNDIELNLRDYGGGIDSSLRIDHIRTSLVPCQMYSPTTFQKLTAEEIYEECYWYAIPAIQEILIPPSSLSEYPVMFSDLTVSLTSRFTNVNSDGLARYVYDIPITHFMIGLPYSEFGVPRDGETLDDIFGNSAPDVTVDFESFDFVRWIETLVLRIGTIEIFPDFYLLYPVIGSVALALIVWILKVFLGG